MNDYRYRGGLATLYDNDAVNNRRIWTKVNDVIRNATKGECELDSSWHPEGNLTHFTVKTSERPVSSANALLIQAAVKKELGTRYESESGYAPTGKTDSPFVTAERDTVIITYKGLPVLPRSPLKSVLMLGGVALAISFILYFFVIDTVRALL